MDKEPPVEFNDLREVAEYAHIGRQAIYLAIKKGGMKAVKKGRKWSFLRKDVDAYILNKYNRDNSKHNGELIFDMDKGFYSVFHVSKFLTIELGYPYAKQRLYFLIRTGRLKASKKGSAWVIAKEDVHLLLQQELLTESILQKTAD